MAKSSFFSGTGTNSTDVDSITSSKAAAEAAAANASESETNAAASESSASTSAINASVSASSASTSASNAAVSATNASTSATSASTSATAAASSATAAAASETAAAASETAAAASETAAGTSETNAATSETNAATSATSAATSATTATTGATTATTKASEASTSATNAATSETNAATSETNAATSETNAATSATNAASSATAAASSASSASTSASAASSAQTAAEAARDATLTAYDNFDDRYLGAKSSAPTVDNDGNALVAGALYFDSTAGAMKVYTGSAWVAAYVSGTDYLPFSGGTMTGDVGHGDNVKATFGASADLQVYHDGFHSRIVETGSGNLKIQATDFEVINAANNEYIARFITDGTCEFRYDNSTKLSTTSSGIDVTGTVVADGLTVRSDYIDLYAADNARNLRITPAVSGTNHIFSSTLTGSGYDFRNSTKLLMKIDGFTNDIFFYEDTGTDAKFCWDASAESLGIGTTTPSTRLHVSTSADNVATFTSTDTGARVVIADSTDTGYINVSSGKVSLGQTEGLSSANLNIDSNGKVGIGTTSPAAGMHVNKAFNATDASATSAILSDGSYGGGIALDDQAQSGWYAQSAGTILKTYVGRTVGTDTAQSQVVMSQYANGNLELYDDTHSSTKLTWDATAEELQLASGVALELNGWTITESGGSLYFATGGTNKMKLDASGNLDVVGSVNSNATIT